MGSIRPAARGELSSWVLSLGDPSKRLSGPPRPAPVDPMDDEDLHLAMAVAHDLSYDGVDGIDELWETDPRLVGALNHWEQLFLDRVHDEVAEQLREDTGGDLVTWLQQLVGASTEPDESDHDEAPSDSISGWLLAKGELWHVREDAVHRSLYQRREADPHTFGLPRLRGRAKAALVTIQIDEYGHGRLEDMHAELFAHTMTSLELDTTPGAWRNHVPGVTFASNNLVSIFARSRRHLGALIGHLALFEMASVPVMATMSRAYARLGCNAWSRLFFDTHVVADATHQRLAAHELAGTVVAEDPSRDGEIRFGAAALAAVEARLTRHVLGCWEQGRPSLQVALSPFDPNGLPALEPAWPGEDPREPAEAIA